MASNPQTLQVEVNQLGGIDERYRTDPTAASVVQDMTLTQQGTWKQCGGFRGITSDYYNGSDNPFPTTGVISSLHWFTQHNGAKQHLIWETGAGALRTFDGSRPKTNTNRPWTNLRTVEDDPYDASTLTRTIPSGPAVGTVSAVWGGRIFLVNGEDEPIQYDGRRVMRAGYAFPPGSPTAAATRGRFRYYSLGMGTVDGNESLGSGNYNDKTCGWRYRYSFVNKYGAESPLSDPSNTVAVRAGANEHNNPYAGVWLSIGKGPPGTVARRVYRTRDLADSDGNFDNPGRAEVFYYLDEVRDNVTVTFEDARPDSLLGFQVNKDNLGPWPRRATLAAVFKNTMWLAVDNTLHFSANGSPEVFPTYNKITLSSSQGGPITAMYASKNALVVFQRRAVHLIRGSQGSGFSSDTLTESLGTSAHKAIGEVPGQGLLFASEEGVYLLTGTLATTAEPTRIVDISTPIEKTYARLNKSALPAARGALYRRDREFWLAIPELGSADNTKVLVYHYEYKTWSTRSGFPISDMLAADDHRGYLHFGSHDAASHPGIHIYTHGVTEKGDSGPAVTPTYETSPSVIDSRYRATHPTFLHVYCLGVGANDIEVRFRINRGLTQSTMTDDGDRDQQLLGDAFDVYGTPTWTTGTWAKLRPIVVRFDLTSMRLPPIHEFQVEFKAASTRVELVGYQLEYLAGDKRGVRVLSATYGPTGV